MEFDEIIKEASELIYRKELSKPKGSKDDPLVCICTNVTYTYIKKYLIENNLFFNEYNGRWYKFEILNKVGD